MHAKRHADEQEGLKQTQDPQSQRDGQMKVAQPNQRPMPAIVPLAKDELAEMLSTKHKCRVSWCQSTTFQVCPFDKGPTLGRSYLLGESVKAECLNKGHAGKPTCQICVHGGRDLNELVDVCVSWLSRSSCDRVDHLDHASKIRERFGAPM